MRDLWQSHEASNYSFIYQIDCFCPPESLKPYRIIVSNGVIVSAVSLDGKTEIEQSFLSSLQTIPQLFNLIARAIANDAYKLEVNYDPTYGYPNKIFVNYKRNIADDDAWYKIWDLQFSK
jgi:Family of unknown function (DUF6174)